MCEFFNRLIMNYLFSFICTNNLLFEPEIGLVWLISFPCELFTRLTMIQSHAELTFQTLFGLLLRILPSY
jgi:hypothetical protein